jgi:hypothetical protein
VGGARHSFLVFIWFNMSPLNSVTILNVSVKSLTTLAPVLSFTTLELSRCGLGIKINIDVKIPVWKCVSDCCFVTSVLVFFFQYLGYLHLLNSYRVREAYLNPPSLLCYSCNHSHHI